MLHSSFVLKNQKSENMKGKRIVTFSSCFLLCLVIFSISTIGSSDEIVEREERLSSSDIYLAEETNTLYITSSDENILYVFSTQSLEIQQTIEYDSPITHHISRIFSFGDELFLFNYNSSNLAVLKIDPDYSVNLLSFTQDYIPINYDCIFSYLEYIGFISNENKLILFSPTNQSLIDTGIIIPNINFVTSCNETIIVYNTFQSSSYKQFVFYDILKKKILANYIYNNTNVKLSYLPEEHAFAALYTSANNVSIFSTKGDFQRNITINLEEEILTPIFESSGNWFFASYEHFYHYSNNKSTELLTYNSELLSFVTIKKVLTQDSVHIFISTPYYTYLYDINEDSFYALYKITTELIINNNSKRIYFIDFGLIAATIMFGAGVIYYLVKK